MPTSRLRKLLGAAVSKLVNAVVLLLVLFFAVASITGQVKRVRGCFGCSGKDERAKITLRELADSNDDDRRLGAALRSMAEAGGLPLDKVRVAVAVTDEVNAATFDETSFLLFEGLRTAPPGALDAIMAHEVAHAAMGHSRKAGRLDGAVRIATGVVGALLGAGSVARDEAASWTSGVTLPTYSREKELEADAAAVQILAKAGYDGDANDVMQGTLTWLGRETRTGGGGFLDSHPAIEDRVSSLRRLQGERRRPSDVIEREMKRKIAEVEAAKGQIRNLRDAAANGLPRIRVESLLALVAIKAEMARSASVPVCAAVLAEDSSLLQAAFNTLSEDSTRRLTEVMAESLEASVSGVPAREPSKVRVKKAMQELLDGLPEGDAVRLKALSKDEGRPSTEDLCWGARVLFSRIPELKDRAAASDLALKFFGF